MKSTVAKAALRHLFRLFAVVTACLTVAVAGVLIVTPGPSRIAGIFALIFAGQSLGVLFADWIRDGRVRPQWAAMVRPGDTLVLAMAHHEMTPAHADEMLSRFNQALPGVKVVLTLGVTSMAVEDANGGEPR